MDIDQTLSQEEGNPEIEYQQCPHCSRNFFQGKLSLHLKLCTPNKPMIISPKVTPRKFVEQKQQMLSSKEQRCLICQAKLPAFLYNNHIKKCREKQQRQKITSVKEEDEKVEDQSRKSSTEINFKGKQQVTLPLIKKTAREADTFKKESLKYAYKVKVREELSCFHLAEQIKSVECSSCGRMFSRQAALRHTPICEKLRMKEKYESLFVRGKKREDGDLQKNREKKVRSCLYNRDRIKQFQQNSSENKGQDHSIRRKRKQ